MNTYCALVLGQTVLTLLTLGLAGGWLLIPFRRDDRPYLWLGAPLAGLFALGGSLALLYSVARLPLNWCVWMGLAINIVATALCLLREKPQMTSMSNRVVALLVAIVVASWATMSCNKSSIDYGEPTNAAIDGSDMFGYAMVADWLKDHSASEPLQNSQILESIAYKNLLRESSRPVTFLLMAAAAEVRGTSSLFSYDWASGVILASAILGTAALFSSNALFLVLLVLGATVSSWLSTARTGFMGKSLAYPGGLMLAAFYLSILERPTRWRVANTIAFTPVLAFCVNPVLPPVVIALLLPGYALAVVCGYIVSRFRDPNARIWPLVLRPLLMAGLLASVTLPTYIAYRMLFGKFLPPKPPEYWIWVIPASVDLELPLAPAITAKTLINLMYACSIVLIISLLVALWLRHRTATALICSALFVPVMWFFGMYEVYTFHCLIYPLTLVGIAVLAKPVFSLQDNRASSPGVVGEECSTGSTYFKRIQHLCLNRSALVALLLIAMIGLRIPQFKGTVNRYVYSPPLQMVIQRQSEANALRELIGPDSVDVALGHWADNHFAWAELALQGIPVKFRSPGWEVSVGAYIGVNNPAYDIYAPKARYTLIERDAWAASDSVRWTGIRLKLVEDQSKIAVVGINHPEGVGWEAGWRPLFWVGSTPTTVLINNGTQQPQFVYLCSDTIAGPANPKVEQRTLVYKHDEESGRLELPKKNKAVIPIHLTPGLNKVELSVEEPAEPGLKPGQLNQMLEIHEMRIEPSLLKTQ